MLKKTKKDVGNEGELIAVEFLKKNGYKILQLNYTCNIGEIDIIARHKNILVFIEVKVRTSQDFGDPELAVTKHKRRQIVKASEIFLSQNRINDMDCRFDVVAISNFSEGKDSREIKLLVNAFQADSI